MKQLLLFGALILSTGLLQSQNLVSTAPQNKKVVLEQFTGINCGYCPDGHATSQDIKAQDPDNIFLIYVHTGNHSKPSSTRPDFRTDFGAALANQANATSFPSGTVNRKGRAISRGSWERAVNQTLLENSYVNIAGTATLNTLTKELTLTVEVYYTGNSPESMNKLNVALLQDNTVGYQWGAEPRNTYNHMHRLVHFLTGQWGENITNTSAGAFSQFHYTYQIPDDYRGVEVALENLKLIAFVAEGQDKILTATKVQPNLVNTISNDVAIKKIRNIPPTCLNKISPVIEIENLGGDVLTSLDITYSVNDSNQSTHAWTGNLNPHAKEIILLDEISFTPNEQVNTIEVQLPNDDNNANNTKTSTFHTATEGSTYSTLEIEANANGPTTTWEIINTSGDIVHSGGPYNAFSSHSLELELPDDCYKLLIEDSENIDRSMFFMEDENGTELFKTDPEDENSNSGYFRTNSALSINDVEQESIVLYPNPTNGIIYIENAAGFQVEIYTILGKLIYDKSTISQRQSINLSNYASGIYYVKFQNQDIKTIKKVIVR